MIYLDDTFIIIKYACVSEYTSPVLGLKGKQAVTRPNPLQLATRMDWYAEGKPKQNLSFQFISQVPYVDINQETYLKYLQALSCDTVKRT